MQAPRKHPPHPVSDRRANGHLACEGKVILITGDAVIGQTIAVAFARRGGHVVWAYHFNRQDAEEARRQVEEEGRRCLILAADTSQTNSCQQVVQRTLSEFGRLDFLLHSPSTQEAQEGLAHDGRRQKVKNGTRARAFRPSQLQASLSIVKAAVFNIGLSQPSRGKP